MRPSPPHEIAPVFIYQPRFCAPAWRPCRFPHGLTIHPSPIAARWGRCRAGAHASVALGLPVGAGGVWASKLPVVQSGLYTHGTGGARRRGDGGMGSGAGYAFGFRDCNQTNPNPRRLPKCPLPTPRGWMDGWMHSCTDARLHAWLDRWMLGRSIIHPSFLLPNLADG